MVENETHFKSGVMINVNVSVEIWKKKHDESKKYHVIQWFSDHV